MRIGLRTFAAALALLFVAAPAEAQLRGIRNVTPPTLGDGDQAQLQLDATGNLKVSLTGGSSTSNSNCLVVTGDQSYTLSSTQQLTCTTSGRLKVGLSSATNIAAGASPSSLLASDLVGCQYQSTTTTWSNLWTGSITCTSSGEIRVNDANLISALQATVTPTGAKGSPPSLLVGTQDANTFIDSGLQTLSSQGAAYTMDLSTEGSAFTFGAVEVTGVGTGGQLIVNCSIASTGQTYPALRLQSVTGGGDAGNIASTGVWYFPAPCAKLRFYANTLTSGSITFYARASRAAFPARTVFAQSFIARTSEAISSNGSQVSAETTREGATIVRQFAIPESTWNYASPTGGINNSTTEITLCAALASNRCYLQHLCFDNDTLGGASEFLIEDGSGGTVLKRPKLQTTAGARCISYDIPVKTTPGNGMFAKFGTAVTGASLVNAEGFYAQ